MMAVSKRTRFEVLRRDSFTCRYCRATDAPLTVDHVTPVALGGTDKPDNLVAACRDCNAGKASSSPDEGTVTQVADDAVRWAAAMKAAYDEANVDLKKRRAYIRKFERTWDKFKSGSNPVSRPTAYANTVGHWFQIEVPFEVVEYAVERAMANDKIRNADVFRYMCGIVWKRVEDARDKAAASVRAEDEATALTTYQDARTFPSVMDSTLDPCCDFIRGVAEARMGLGSMVVTDFIDRRESRILLRMRDHDCEVERILTPPSSWFEVAHG